MIKVSSQALAVIRTVSGHPRLGDDSGLQITQSSTSHADLKVTAVPKPCTDADVVETVGGRLFLGPGVAARMADRELHVEDDEMGRKQFLLREAS